jgi:hypothetical protein
MAAPDCSPLSSPSSSVFINILAFEVDTNMLASCAFEPTPIDVVGLEWKVGSAEAI